jgi:enoyl-CoA hydratase/carnithine racemase/predicted small metal-binding protein
LTKAIYCDCGLICRGDSDEELLRAAEEHLRREHPALAGRVRGDDLLAMAVEVEPDPMDDAVRDADVPLAVRRDGAIATLVMNRPASRNALSLDQMRTLRRELEAIGADGGVRAVVIGSAGPVFCSGHDLRELRGADGAAAQTIFEADTALMRAIRQLPQPVVARVQGPATAAGCHLVAACDLAVASSQATFAVPGPVMGLVGATAMVEVSRLIGRRRATQMLLTGAPVSAATALNWGLVNAVVPAGELATAARALASSASSGAPETTAMAKRGLHESLERPIDAAYEWAVDLTVRTIPGDEAQEGIGAFLAKRPPTWRAGRRGA